MSVNGKESRQFPPRTKRYRPPGVWNAVARLGAAILGDIVAQLNTIGVIVVDLSSALRQCRSEG